MFEHRTKIFFEDTDAAGVMFYAKIFNIIHRAYEIFLEAADFPISSILDSEGVILPILHTEASYKAPLRAGDNISIRIFCVERNDFKYKLEYQVYTKDTLAVIARTSHICLGNASREGVLLPDNLRNALDHIKG